MLKQFHLCLHHARRVKRYRRLAFEPGLTVLIGPNGTGKSTLLRAIAGCAECRRIEEGPTEYTLLDAERMNPHLAQEAAGTYADMVLRSRAQFSSHGETLQDAFRLLRVSPRTCLLLDEPEAGQDADHLFALRAAMRRAAARGVQVICATHQILFWDAANTIELRRGFRDRVIRAYCAASCARRCDEPG
jgi:predicted ATPase